MIEVEVRSWLHPSMQIAVQKKLGQMRLLRDGVSLDIYVDTPELALLRHPQMVFFRLREAHLLQIKFDATHSSRQPPPCIEREFELASGLIPDALHPLMQTFLPSWQQAATWQEIIQVNHLEELVRIEKQRRVYQDGFFLVSVDDVAQLGSFIEVEINCAEDADISEAQALVDEFLAGLGGTPLKAGYFEMWLYFHRHEAYQFIPERFRVEAHLLPPLNWGR